MKVLFATLPDIHSLNSHFIQCLLAINNTIEPATSERLWQDIAIRYNEPVRAYHTLSHLQQLFSQFELVRENLQQPNIVALALYYHDIVYDPARQDNELQSALLFKQAYANILPNALIERVYELIILTATHELTDRLDNDAAYLLDMDLSILGTSWQEYKGYAQAIRQEYAHVATADYRSGRSNVLKGLLAHPRLYLTDYYYRHLEQLARLNIEREIQSLCAD